MKYEGTICDVHGIRVGQAQNPKAETGVTVVLCSHSGAVVGTDVRGAAPGTMETDLCRPENTVRKVNAIVLSGGSSFGLASTVGVKQWLEENGYGLDMGVCRVPIVPAAVIYDLSVGDPSIRPDAEMGRRACENASKKMRQGLFGAGTGATVGKLVPGAIPAKGGVGSASILLNNGITVGAIAVVNACGDIYENGNVLACGRLPDGKPILARDLLFGSAPSGLNPLIADTSGMNTTIAVVATDAELTKAEAQRLATCAHDGYARVIRPVHTQMDGDTVFALATCKKDTKTNLLQLCEAAAEVMERAIINAFYAEEKRL